MAWGEWGGERAGGLTLGQWEMGGESLTHHHLSVLLTQGPGKGGPRFPLTSGGRCTALTVR